MKAYRKEHGLELADIPFVALTRRFNLFASDADVKGLIEEIQGIVEDYGEELALVIIDTFSAATTGMDENSSKDVSQVRARIVKIQLDCNCTVLFVHHMNASGERQRGHSSITADVESVLKIDMLTRFEGKTPVPVLDDNERPIRRITNFKQREAATGDHYDFVLVGREVRTDADGDPVTSCVSLPPARTEVTIPERMTPKKERAPQRGEGFQLWKDAELKYFKAVLQTIEKKALHAPANVKLPPGVRGVASLLEVNAAFRDMVPNEEKDAGTAEGDERHYQKLKKQAVRARDTMLKFELLAMDKPGDEAGHIIWPTGKKVWGDKFQWPPAGPAPVEYRDEADQGSILDYADSHPDDIPL